VTAAALPPIVLTGASGFIGRRILQRLADLSADRVTVLTRDPAALEGSPCWRTGWRATRVDLALDDISPSLLDGAVVLHLAAATGRAAPAEMRRANVDGTARMVRAARTGGAANFVFVSSIAVRYAERRWYHYAESKIESEALLAASGLAHAIVRPTMVFGQGSPCGAGCALCLPVPSCSGRRGDDPAGARG
jgi:nucleoside-diphosphate-sugar epimerase